MKIAEFAKSLYLYLTELSVRDWSKLPLSRITSQRAIPSTADVLSRRAHIDIPTGELRVVVRSAKDYGQWPAGYDPKITTDRYGTLAPAPAAGYNTTLRWQGWNAYVSDYYRSYKAGREFYGPKTKKELIDHLIREMDVLLHCNCPSFYWQGMQYGLTTIDAARDPSTWLSKKWLPKHRAAGARYPVCKHLYAVLKQLTDSRGYLYGKMYREIQKDPQFDRMLSTVFKDED